MDFLFVRPRWLFDRWLICTQIISLDDYFQPRAKQPASASFSSCLYTKRCCFVFHLVLLYELSARCPKSSQDVYFCCAHAHFSIHHMFYNENKKVTSLTRKRIRLSSTFHRSYSNFCILVCALKFGSTRKMITAINRTAGRLVKNVSTRPILRFQGISFVQPRTLTNNRRCFSNGLGK
jgi:hypothetical protein